MTELVVLRVAPLWHESVVAVVAVAVVAIVAIVVATRPTTPPIVLVVVKAPTSNPSKRDAMQSTFSECQRILSSRSFGRGAHLVYTYATDPSKLFNVPTRISARAYRALHRDTTAITTWIADYVQSHPLAGLDDIVRAAADSPHATTVDADTFLQHAFGAKFVGSVDRPDLVGHYFKTPTTIATVHDRPNCARQRHWPGKLCVAADAAQRAHAP